MNNTCPVSFTQPLADLNRIFDDLIKRQGLIMSIMVKRFSLNMLHDEVWAAVEFADVMNSDNIGMVKLGYRLRFSIEAVFYIFLWCQMYGQEFYCHSAVQTGVICKINLTHSAHADLSDDPIGGNHCPFSQDYMSPGRFVAAFFVHFTFISFARLSFAADIQWMCFATVR